jgi:PAS domain S-box-containing protein
VSMRPLQILSLEDDPQDAELIQALLEPEDFDFVLTRASTRADFVDALDRGQFDLILADYTLPSFDGLSALKMALERCPDVPFIFVSGTLGEEVAIEALKIGATDYVLKTRLSRLVPSVHRALREARDRLNQKQTEEALRRSEAFLNAAQKLSRTGSFGWSVSAGDLYWSNETFRILDYEKRVIPSIDLVLERTHPEDRDIVQRTLGGAAAQQQDLDFEHRLRMPDGSVKHVRVVAYGSVSQENGAMHYIGAITDITERKRAEDDLRRALEEIQSLKDQLYEENVALREEIDKTSMFEEIVGESQALRAVLARVAKVAPTDSTVLINGETGTGKELIARAIHKRSQRASRAFVSINCAATPETLIAAELFGHEKGAFTGAMQRRLGKFELAQGGTLFLDEIGELPMEAQIALLRVLQEREFERVGGSYTIRADVRVIAATNRDLHSAIAAGAFRKDLYYRLDVLPIEIPPLREHQADIPTLIEYFIQRYARKAGKKITTIEKRTMDLLQTYEWPGNVRELQNVIERSVIFCDAEVFAVDPSWLSFESSSGGQDGETTTRKSPAEEKAAIEAALSASAGRVSGPSGAATKLGIPASTLESKIRALGINKFLYKKI